MDAATLQKLMDPKNQDLQARYENARYSVSEGYRLASKYAYLNDHKVAGPDGKAEYIPPTQEEIRDNMITYARHVAKEIEKDLNDALKILEKKD